MAYYAGDIPAHDLVIEPAQDLTGFTGATATLTPPTGTASTLDAAIDGDTIVVTWPETSPFPARGLYQVRATVTTAGGSSERIPTFPIVVQDDTDGWHSLDSARDAWPDAENLTDLQLYTILETAKADVIAYAPELAVDVLPPLNYTEAQKMHARDIWNASTVSTDGGQGDGTFIVRPFPLDWMVKQILRPKRGIPGIA